MQMNMNFGAIRLILIAYLHKNIFDTFSSIKQHAVVCFRTPPPPPNIGDPLRVRLFPTKSDEELHVDNLSM